MGFPFLVISTDAPQYAAVAERYGAEAPFLRPPELSGDALAAKLQKLLQHEVSDGLVNVLGAPPLEGFRA